MKGLRVGGQSRDEAPYVLGIRRGFVFGNGMEHAGLLSMW